MGDGKRVLDFGLNAYQAEAVRTEQQAGWRDLLLKNTLGLAGEVGEFVELVKHDAFHGRPMDLDAAKKELGDILWYLATTAHALGFALDDVAITNVDKLRKRYPDGYTHGASAARADETHVAVPVEGWPVGDEG